MYDNTVGTNEIEHFIGPNRKDSLVEKLNKLKYKQLPLLHSNECKLYLDQIHLIAEDIEQQVYFKAQLFVPFAKKELELKILNQNCISGFYIYQHDIKQFFNCKFYLPTKKDWLIEPNSNVEWLNFTAFNTEVDKLLARKFSPMVWMKQSNGEIFKLFVVWWKK